MKQLYHQKHFAACNELALALGQWKKPSLMGTRIRLHVVAKRTIISPAGIKTLILLSFSP
jgi:hypothetical protein